MAKLPLKTIPLSSLTVGMHIAKLDIPWIKSPFITHSRLVKSSKDIALLREAGVSTVVIDPNKGKDTKGTKDTPETKETAAEENVSGTDNKPQEVQADIAEVETPPANTEKNADEKAQALEQDIEAAKKVRDVVRRGINQALDALAAGNSINREDLTPLIDQTLASIEKNNQALLNIVHSHGRSQKLADHTFSTFCLALDLARNQQLSPEDIESLGVAALLHEAGWTHIPLHLMGKRSPYTPAEKKLIEQHTTLAIRAVKECNVSDLTRRIIAEHHELCNGKGYPKHLTGEAIHPLSKLFTVVDQYDEYVHQLSDKNGLTPTSALRKLYLDAEKKAYDADAVSQLISLLGVYPISSAVTLSDGSMGIVRDVPESAPLKPLIEVRINAKGKALPTPLFHDLSQSQDDANALLITQAADLTALAASDKQRLQLHV